MWRYVMPPWAMLRQSWKTYRISSLRRQGVSFELSVHPKHYAMYCSVLAPKRRPLWLTGKANTLLIRVSAQTFLLRRCRTKFSRKPTKSSNVSTRFGRHRSPSLSALLNLQAMATSEFAVRSYLRAALRRVERHPTARKSTTSRASAPKRLKKLGKPWSAVTRSFRPTVRVLQTF